MSDYKEYLMPSRNYEYILTDAREALEPHAEDWIEIPEGAEILTGLESDKFSQVFWKPSSGEVYQDGAFRGYNFHKSMSYEEYKSNWTGNLVLWQREQDEPFLTPECTLNDQYAEIHGTVKAEPDFNFGAAQAIGGAKMRENNHYFIDVSDVDEVDFYEIAKRYNVADPAIQHILKKCLAIGNRGHKDLETDLKDILKTAKRALQINGFGE